MRTRWNYLHYSRDRLTIFEYDPETRILYAEVWRSTGRKKFVRESRWPTTPEVARSYAENAKTFLEVTDTVADQIRACGPEK